MSGSFDADEAEGTLADQVDRLQEIRPVAGRAGHEVCADIHTALSVAHTVLTSRNQRVADSPESESSETLLRELRALGIGEAAPQLIAMVAIVDTAVDQLADSGAMSEADAWEQLHKDVLRRHCQSPDTW